MTLSTSPVKGDDFPIIAMFETPFGDCRLRVGSSDEHDIDRHDQLEITPPDVHEVANDFIGWNIAHEDGKTHSIRHLTTPRQYDPAVTSNACSAFPKDEQADIFSSSVRA